MSITYHITEMHCPNCAAHVTRTIEGVCPQASVEVDLKSQQVRVDGAQPDDDALRAALEAEGYELHGRLGS